uniref:Aminotransferase class I/classII large domain-containing protein n=1 Tax=Palpitomonas bilix TaxID=652834 RepID=A0A7S3CZB2_9EUKA|mmetsp:Transcript_1566/g.3179  ORF Transcript_1566/g.3179 Transcript_1566/m.3179 type:complete len:451 (+) Transcript_1566:89-1441(+)
MKMRVASRRLMQHVFARSVSSIAPASRLNGVMSSVFSVYTQLANQHKAINLGQGFPDCSPPSFLLEEAAAVLTSPTPAYHQYAPSEGAPPLVSAICSLSSLSPTPDCVTVTNGATEALFSTFQALLNHGDEVVVMEPFYDSYIAQVQMAGGKPVCVPLRVDAKGGEVTAASQFKLDVDELRRAVSDKTRLIVLNSPHNPTGKVFTTEELEQIAQVAIEKDLIVVSDEVYEWLAFADRADTVKGEKGASTKPASIAAIAGMKDRTVTIGSAGKTFEATGWKVGWAIASPQLSKYIAAAHKWVPFSVATPLQVAVGNALLHARDNGYFAELSSRYQRKRDLLDEGLERAGLTPMKPDGGFFILADTSLFPSSIVDEEKELARREESGSELQRDEAIARWMTKKGVCVIPPSAFYRKEHKHLAENWVRVCFAKSDDTLTQAGEKLEEITRPFR